MFGQISAGDVTFYQTLVAWGLALFLIATIAGSVALLKYRGIDHDQRRHLYSIRPQLMEARPETVSVGEGDLSGLESRVRDDLRGRSALGGEPTVRQTLRTLVVTLRAALARSLPSGPRLAIRGGLEGAVILAAGLLAWASIAWVEWILDADAPLPGRDAAAAALAALPYWEVVGAVVLSAVVLVWAVLVTYWWALGIALVGGAVLLALVDRRTVEDLSVTLFPDRLALVTGVTIAVVATYLFAAVPTVLGRWAGYPRAGQWVGLAFGGCIAALAVVIGASDLRRALVRRQSRSESNTRAVAAYLLIRKTFGTLALIGLPVAAYLLVEAGRTVWPWIASNPRTTAVVVTGVVVLVPVLVWAGCREQAGEVIAALGRWLRSARVRGFLFARGIPGTAVFFVFLLAWAFGLQASYTSVPVLAGLLGLFPTLTTAVLVGIVVRLITLAWARLKYRFVRFEDPGGPASATVALFPPVEDADGVPLYVARVGGHYLANRNPGALGRDVERVVRRTLAGEAVGKTFSRYYWEDVEFGTVDVEQVRRELEGDVRSRMVATIDAHDGVEYEVIDEELVEKYPREAVEWAKRQEMKRGNVSRQDGEYVLHR